MSIFSDLFRRRRPAPSFEPPAPEEPLTVLGDIHGRADLLAKALDRATGRIVLVGDYVDRGEASADVLRMLLDRPDIICLMGNHEEMLLRTLDDPDRYGSGWLRHGGLQTLASFGIAGVVQTTSGSALAEARDGLADSMGQEMIDWMCGLPSAWRSGNVFVTHAGADPALPLDDQSGKVLRWGHPDFAKVPRRDGLWVVHGHTISDEPVMENGRIGIDTGAYASGRLTMAHLESVSIRFETVT